MRKGARGFILLAALGVACTGDGGTGPGGNPTTIMTRAEPSGEGQVGGPSRALLDPLQVRLSRGTAPVVGQAVTWSVASGGGSILVNDAVTNQDGVSSAIWILGPTEGTNSVTASSAGANGSPITFTATAIDPPNAVTITVTNNAFVPSTVLVAAGGTVTFDWAASARQHSIIPIVGNIPNVPIPLKDGPRSDQFTFAVAGKYDFFCSNHGTPSGGGMAGRITVQ